MELELQRARIDADQSRLERDRAMLAASSALNESERARTEAELRAATCEARLAEATVRPSEPPADRTTVVEGRFSLSDGPSDETLALPTAVTVSVEGERFREDFAADPFGRIALELPPGRHVVTVSAAGYVSQRFAVELPTPSGSLLLAATLLQRPGKRPPAQPNRRGSAGGKAQGKEGVVKDPFTSSGSSPRRQRPKGISDPFERGTSR